MDNLKIKSRPQLKSLAAKLRRQGKKIVFTNGCFDILHAGHVMYLKKAKSFGDHLIVGLNSDLSVRKIKGKTRPVQNERDRALILSSLAFVGSVSVFSDPTPIRLIMAVKPHVLVKGGDWPLSKIVGAKEVKGWGGRVKRVRLLKGRSTTAVLKKISKL